MRLESTTFHGLRGQIQQLCGIVVAEDKQYLVHHRLEPVIRERGMRNFEQLYQQLGLGSDPALIDAVVNAVTTQETAFFRDPQVFEALASHILPRLATTAGKSTSRTRIWSAGTSTGQEAYSLAILAAEFAANSGAGRRAQDAFEVLGSDVSSSAIATAAAGIYPARDVIRGLSPGRLRTHFQKHGQKFHVNETLRGLTQFRRLNLVAPLAGIGPFDLICCRNVLIYFDLPTRRRFCQQCARLLADSGWLLLGAAENLYGISDEFVSMPLGTNGLIYRKA